MGEKTTIYDIAKELNISAATVSRALNNNPKISESTCKLVMETATRMNYKQNRLALALRSGRSNNVGVIVPRIDSNFFASTIRGIEEELYSHKYNVIICQTHEDEKREIENITKKEIRDFMNSSNATKIVVKMIQAELGTKKVDDKIIDLSTKVVVELFKTLWQRKSFWETALKNVPIQEPAAPEGIVNVGGEWFYDEFARSWNPRDSPSRSLSSARKSPST